MLGTGGSILTACGGSDDSSSGSGAASSTSKSSSSSATTGACTDLSGLSSKEKKQRKQMVEALKYVRESPQANRNCSNCQLYTESEYGEGCGGCTLFPGPVNAKGYCNSWAPVV